MAPLPILLGTVLAYRDAVTATNNVTSSDTIQVVCAWPVSGQYGPGSRVLYYVLVAACVFGQEADLIRKACLAGALLFPAVAAIHGIVLAATHVDGAVDMDVYGAFQLCAVGVLAAPVNVRFSKTYFNDPGRNAIFGWSALLIAGLLSLAIEFYRVATSPCADDNPGDRSADNFAYGIATCGLVCTVDDGPFSPIRRGAGNNIYVIPAPDKFSFGMATLLAAACCIPAILLLVSMWLKILEEAWKKSHKDAKDLEIKTEPTATENGDTPRRRSENDDTPARSETNETPTEFEVMTEPAGNELDATTTHTGDTKIKRRLRQILAWFREYYVYPIFGAAVLAVLIIGERNLFSPQVRYQTEPVVNIGQWAPIVGTALAILGSLYMVLADAMEQEAKRGAHSADGPGEGQRGVEREEYPCAKCCPKSQSGGMKNMLRPLASRLLTLSDFIGTPADKRYDDSSFQNGNANEFPEIPGERGRNQKLDQVHDQWGRPDRSVTPAARSQRSRAGSDASKDGVEHIEGSSRERAGSRPRRDTANSLQLPTATRTRSQTISSALPRRILTSNSSGSQNPPEIVVSPVETLSSFVGESGLASGKMPEAHYGV